ncbi:MAG: hypothetical protein ACOX65_01780 [Anaerotruncus rubiinfantis]
MTSIYLDTDRPVSTLNPAIFQLIAARDQLQYSSDSCSRFDETGAAILRMAAQAVGKVIEKAVEETSRANSR